MRRYVKSSSFLHTIHIKKQEEISISNFPLTPEKGFAFSQQKTRMGERKTTQKNPRHFKSHLCSNDTRARDKKCVCGFSFRKGGLIKMESFLPLHYFGRNFLYNHILLWSLFLLYEALHMVAWHRLQRGNFSYKENLRRWQQGHPWVSFILIYGF